MSIFVMVGELRGSTMPSVMPRGEGGPKEKCPTTSKGANFLSTPA